MSGYNSDHCMSQNGFSPVLFNTVKLYNYEPNKFTDNTSQSTRMPDSSSLGTQMEKSNGLLRRKRLERTTAHQNVSASTDLQSEMTKFSGNLLLSENNRSDTQTNQSNEIISHSITLSTTNSIELDNSKQKKELNNDTINNIYSGKDVSYV